MDRTERILDQGQALVRAIEALETIEPTGPIERAHARFLLQAYRLRLRAIVEAAPEAVREGTLEILLAPKAERLRPWQKKVHPRAKSVIRICNA